MILKWIQSMGQAAGAKAAAQADEEDRRVRKDAKLLDVAHEALAERAAKDSATLDALARLGAGHLQREELKGKVRRKVWDVVKDESSFSDAALVEEITERIADAAEVDPYFRRIFNREST